MTASCATFFPHVIRKIDLWMARTYPNLPWCRYADDGLVHCRNEQEAQALKVGLQVRFAKCHLELHRTKTKIVYCKDRKRKDKHPNVKFDFLGYCFRSRRVRRFPGQNAVLWIQSRSQSRGDEGHAVHDSGVEPSLLFPQRVLKSGSVIGFTVEGLEKISDADLEKFANQYLNDPIVGGAETFPASLLQLRTCTALKLLSSSADNG
ncbi:MAG TPA: reverse transcriptase domain-containing protein [Candidatus Angelobacter sp.]|jgi:hypothetical protein